MNLSETENAARSDQPTGTPGAVLGAARQDQNLSVADVARQLKLSVHQVEALEAGQHDKLPGPVFVRGFIRNYARLLKLDPERLMDSVARSMPQEEPRPAAPPSQEIPFPGVAPRRWPKYAVALAVALIALAVYEFYPDMTRPAVTSSASVSPSVPPALQPDAQALQPGAPSPASDAGSAGAQLAPATAPTQAAAQDAAPAVSKSDPRVHEVAVNPEEREVHMVFEKESWVEIRDRSGTAIFSQLNRGGTEKRVNGRPPLSVIVGNSRGVRLTYDDQPVDLSRYTKIDVARLTLQ